MPAVDVPQSTGSTQPALTPSRSPCRSLAETSAVAAPVPSSATESRAAGRLLQRRDDYTRYSVGMFVGRHASARIKALAMGHDVRVVVPRRREIVQPWFMRLRQHNPFE